MVRDILLAANKYTNRLFAYLADVATAIASGYDPVEINAGTLSATLVSSINKRFATPGRPTLLAAIATVAYAPLLMLDDKPFED
jgi:hypothetical protein